MSRIIVPSRKLIAPKPGIKYQRGFLTGGSVKRGQGGGGGVNYLLTGTSGVPIVSSVSRVSPTDAVAGWYFESATYDIDREQFAGRSYYADWVDAAPPDIWIRATNHAEDNPTGGSGLGTWLKLTGTGSANRFWTWTETTNGFADTKGTLHVELATDSGGVTIVDEGYYRGVASVEL